MKKDVFKSWLHKKHLRDNAAFTFIELLISMTIFSIIAVTIYYTLNTGIRVWRKGNNVVGQNQELRLFFTDIATDLRNAVFFSGSETRWDGHEMAFMTLENVSYGDETIREMVKVVYEFSEPQGRLTRKKASLKEGFNEMFAEEQRLLDDVREFSIEYCYEGAFGGGEYFWSPEWEFEDKIPRGVKIKILLESTKDYPSLDFENIYLVPLGELGSEAE